MNDRYPISGIKQSYRHTRETRTVVMPLLICLVLGGLVVFYLKTRPGPPASIARGEADGAPILRAVPIEEVTSAAPTSPAGAPERPGATTGAEIGTATGASPDAVETFARSTDDSSSLTPLGFTPWMSPLALDNYILKKNEGYTESFWKRGHWITAVEGRWHEGTHQFRISYEPIPDNRWAWRYRANKTRDEFFAEDLRLREEGFTLVQVQMFQHPDRSFRCQGVWRKKLEPAIVAGNDPEAAFQGPPAPR